jgi:starch phosphorylase
MSLIDESEPKRIRMAHLAIVGSHSTNGVAAIHSQLLQTRVVPDFAAMFPDRFNNKTNGVTQRRFLLIANPPLAGVITTAIGDRWISDLSHLQALAPLAYVPTFLAAVGRARREAKRRFAEWLVSATGQVVDPDTLFDTHIKRIHEYKRQLLNALHIVILYQRLRGNPSLDAPARTFLFGGKAAPAYTFAKLVIKFINNVAATIDRDAAVRERLKVVFVPDYGVSVAERLIPASDVSEQISTAGYEARGTGNMKFMMNGALTIGTRDGATIEMALPPGRTICFSSGERRRGRLERGPIRSAVHYDNEPGNAGGNRSHRRRSLQPRRTRHLRADRRRTPSRRRSLPRARGFEKLLGRAVQARRVVPTARPVVPQGRAQHRRVGRVFKRPDDRRVRARDLADRPVSDRLTRVPKVLIDWVR